MDKLKRKAKAKRREERMKHKRAEARELMQKFNEKCKAEGRKNGYKQHELSRAYAKIQSNMAEEAIIATTVAVLITMRRIYGWGARRLHKLAGEITVMISDVGNKRRTPAQLTETLLEDARLDYKQYWSEQRTEFAPDTKKSVFLCAYARQTACVQILAIFYMLFKNGSITRRSKRMERISESIANITEHIVKSGRLTDYTDELAKCGLNVTKSGQFSSTKITAEELENLKRRMTA